MVSSILRSKILTFIRERVGTNSVLIGLSGGIDSTITCALAIEALGAKKVKGVLARNTRYPNENLIEVRKFAEEGHIELQEVDTTTFPSDMFSTYGPKVHEEVVSSTIDARICDFILRTISNLDNRIYLGTINGTERLTGWYPKGALVGDICPIGGLLKTQEKELAQEMGLQHLLETISEDSSRICSGCGELPAFKGISYETLDKILLAYETLPYEQLESSLEQQGISKEVVHRILQRVEDVTHKHDVFPAFLKIN